MKNHQRKALKEALKLPGMESHIRRLKASWKEPNPSQDIIYGWVKHEVAKRLYAAMLQKLCLSELMAMHQSGISALAMHAVETTDPRD